MDAATTPYWRPELGPPVEPSHRATLVDKLGGLPWGLPAERWPRCPECEGLLTLHAQLQHHAERLDLGRSGRVLFVFQCDHRPGLCETWSVSSTASVALVVEPEALQSGTTAAPEPTPLLSEVEVLAWHPGSDPVDPARFEGLFDQGTYDDIVGDADLLYGAKAGGVPVWIQSASEGPSAPFRYVLQLAEGVSGANYGSGLAYVFVDRAAPAAVVFWQC